MKQVKVADVDRNSTKGKRFNTKLSIYQLLLAAASSNLAGRKQKCYFIVPWGCFCLSDSTETRVCCHFSKNSDKNLALLINKHVCLVFSNFKITLFPI